MRKLGLASVPSDPAASVSIASGHTHGVIMLAKSPACSPKMTV